MTDEDSKVIALAAVLTYGAEMGASDAADAIRFGKPYEARRGFAQQYDDEVLVTAYHRGWLSGVADALIPQARNVQAAARGLDAITVMLGTGPHDWGELYKIDVEA